MVFQDGGSKEQAAKDKHFSIFLGGVQTHTAWGTDSGQCGGHTQDSSGNAHIGVTGHTHTGCVDRELLWGRYIHTRGILWSAETIETHTL